MPALTVAVIANGEAIDKDILRRYLKGTDKIIAADGGSILCRCMNIIPDYILGDMDSIDENTRRHFASVPFITREDQNHTDMQKALQFAIELGAQQIRLFAAFGLRGDHSAANLIIFESFDAAVELQAYDNHGLLTRLFPGEHHFEGQPGQTVSFFSLRPLKKLTLQGFAFPLKERDYAPFFLGNSNRYAAALGRVSFTAGRLLVYHPFPSTAADAH